MKRLSKCVILMCILVLSINMSVYAADDESESCTVELTSFAEEDTSDEVDQFVDGIYNVGSNARASMTGVMQLSQAGTKIQANYSTSYTSVVDQIGVKNVKLDYKGSLGVWYNIITLDDRYRTNKSTYAGAFTCAGVPGRIYRLQATHYIKNGSYTQNRYNITEDLTFR